MPKQNLRCFVDCTETVCSGINTGIQRTVRNIIGRHELISKTYGIEIIPVVALDGKFYRYNVDSDRKIFAPFLSWVFGTVRNLLDKFCYGNKVNIDVTPPLPASLHLSPQEEQEDIDFRRPAGGGHLYIIEFCRKIIPFFFRCAFYLDHAFASLTEAKIAACDIIFYPDAFWCRSTYLSFSRYQAIKILLLHDVIPLILPKACDPVYVVSFRNTLDIVLDNVDGVITISRTELAKIRSLLRNSGDSVVPLLDYNYWGADFAAKVPDSDDISPFLKELFSTCRSFIMVGTLEPRKNHAFVLDAFEKFWELGGEASLCIIGKVSLLCSDLKKRIDNHKYFGSRLYLFQNLGDAELAYCYKECAGVIFASLAEGFGLPMVEAMWYGCPVFASDLDVFREIGGVYPIYFPTDSTERLVQLLQLQDSRVERRQPCQWRSWDESVLDLFTKVFTMAEMVRTNRV